MKKGDQDEEDRLSDLPDSVILHILSFLNTKQAHQTLILSTRWKNIAKQLPILRLRSSDFKSLMTFGNLMSHSPKRFGNLVYEVLSLRDHSTILHTLDLLEFNDFIEPDSIKSIVEYAVSHDIQLLRTSITCDLQQFPPCLFSSQTLTSLDLCVHGDIIIHSKILFPNSLNMPALTTLTLRSFYFCAGDDGCAEPFSAFSKLSTLMIQDCKLLDTESLCISSTTLVNLTVDECEYYRHSYKCKLSTPSLCNLNYICTLNQKLYCSDLRSLKHVYIDVNYEYSGSLEPDYPFVLNLLLELANIESLTVSSDTLQVLSLVPDLWNVKINSLYNLESLQIKRYRPSTPLYVYGGLNRTTEPAKVVYFLLQNSPLAKVKKRHNGGYMR
ncbi:unnamed protein product [Trifolium pratense]|uniref:Uncharacterized protein n=1 Tax=Trifolium pratense TaxID=57577 RepID=A0ACB0J531_TRIPR|nr:unnamed protein product [Trifolium pratense]